MNTYPAILPTPSWREECGNTEHACVRYHDGCRGTTRDRYCDDCAEELRHENCTNLPCDDCVDGMLDQYEDSLLEKMEAR